MNPRVGYTGFSIESPMSSTFDEPPYVLSMTIRERSVPELASLNVHARHPTNSLVRAYSGASP